MHSVEMSTRRADKGRTRTEEARLLEREGFAVAPGAHNRLPACAIWPELGDEDSSAPTITWSRPRASVLDCGAGWRRETGPRGAQGPNTWQSASITRCHAAGCSPPRRTVNSAAPGIHCPVAFALRTLAGTMRQ